MEMTNIADSTINSEHLETGLASGGVYNTHSVIVINSGCVRWDNTQNKV